jgi:hypothetical protein
MKKALLALLAAALYGASPTIAADIGYDLNIHIGNRSPAPIIVDEPPLFLVPPSLGFQVAVGVPYDMFRIDSRYYLCKDEVWYAAAGYSGPWIVLQRDRLPPGLAKRRYAEIIVLRNEEYGHFKRNRDHYRRDRDHYRRDRDHYRRDHDHDRRDRDHDRRDRDHDRRDRDHYAGKTYHPGKAEKEGHGKGKNKNWKDND